MKHDDLEDLAIAVGVLDKPRPDWGLIPLGLALGVMFFCAVAGYIGVVDWVWSV